MNEQDIMNKLEAVNDVTVIAFVTKYDLNHFTMPNYIWLPEGVRDFGKTKHDIDKLASILFDKSLTSYVKDIHIRTNRVGNTSLWIEVYDIQANNSYHDTNLTGEVVERLLNLAA